MKKGLGLFNIYLAILLGLSAGCQLTKGKETTSLRVFVETTPDNTGRTGPITVGRQQPFSITIEHSSFLNENNIKQASVVDAFGGFQIMLQLDRQGTWLLEQYSVANRGRRVALAADFGEVRWIAAPVMVNPIKDGILTFTPDATREEAERIVRGLNEVAKTAQRNNP